MSPKPHECDECRQTRATLYQRGKLLVCYYCLPDESLSGRGARRAIRAAVTGTVNIERRRSQLRRSLKP